MSRVMLNIDGAYETYNLALDHLKRIRELEADNALKQEWVERCEAALQKAVAGIGDLQAENAEYRRQVQILNQHVDDLKAQNSKLYWDGEKLRRELNTAQWVAKTSQDHAKMLCDLAQRDREKRDWAFERADAMQAENDKLREQNGDLRQGIVNTTLFGRIR